ncbi:MAG: ABC transporter ATP-binding protein [Deltaproteobacteria bacterium]|nr:MAG: ABC transporter ATP-binding protein [Deltaproteobacteria bacterium]
MLNISTIDAFYGGFQALWNVSLEVIPKEIVALIGANGSGKSTLLDTISGLIRPAKGSIEFEGKTITELNPFEIVALGISQVPEGRRVFPDLSVLDNLILGSYNRAARSEKEQNLNMAYELFPILEKRKNQLAKTLSGGEQQMLALGRGLMSSPKLMLLDEMSLGLAPVVINNVYEALRKIRERGITILLVEQNVRRSLDEANRAYIMEAGHIVLSGNAADLREEEEVKRAYFGI